ncbi:MAG: DivIVA domain-containing protein [Negativicoccus succinicivorans]|nr:DivIVA domain-containing protein [Negativicoccus succinicivorans]
MLTPMDIHNKTFSKGLRGYAQEEVEQFLEEVVNDYEKIYREHREMEEETDMLRTKLKNYETMETTMTSTLMMAQETAENVKVNARKEAELIIAKAETEKEQMLRDTADSLRSAQEQYNQIMADISVFRAKLRSLLESQLALVDTMVADPSQAMANYEAVSEVEENSEEELFTVTDVEEADSQAIQEIEAEASDSAAGEIDREA